MFDVRKTQPKLVYVHTGQDTHRDQENRTISRSAPIANTDRIEKQWTMTRTSSQHRQVVTDSFQKPQSLKSQPQIQQQQQQYQQQQVNVYTSQNPEVPGEQSEQQAPKFVRVLSTMKSPATNNGAVQASKLLSSSKAPKASSNNDPYKANPQVNVLANKKIEHPHVYREQVYDTGGDKASQKGPNNSSLLTVPVTEGMKQLNISSSSSGRSPVSSPATGRHTVTASATVAPSLFERSPISSPALGQSSNSSLQQPVPQMQAQNQQYIRYQQQHQNILQQQQQVFRDHARQIQDARLNSAVTTTDKYSDERQHTSLTLAKNSEMPWTIPRVNASMSARPNSMTISSNTSDQTTNSSFISTVYNPPPSQRTSMTLTSARPSDRTSSNSQGDQTNNLQVSPNRSTIHTYSSSSDATTNSQPNNGDFTSYNPSASPRALRSSFRLISEHSHGQSASASSSSSPPKSILKNNLSLEQSDLYLSSRPLILPRVHSEKNPGNSDRDFDFSSILTANKDPLSAKIASIDVTGQVHGLPNSSSLKPQRSATAGNKNELKRKKSVTFNSEVQLHVEDEVSTVQELLADA